MKNVAAVVILVLALAAGHPAALSRPHDDDESPVAAGKYQVSGILSFSSNYFAAGAGFGYFIADGLIPGVRYIFEYARSNVLDYHSTAHDVNLYLRYYFADFGQVLPFLLGEAGWVRYSQVPDSGSPVADLDLSLPSLMGGGGLVVFLSRNFSVEALGGVRKYYNVPANISEDFDETPFEFRFGFGVYL